MRWPHSIDARPTGRARNAAGSRCGAAAAAMKTASRLELLVCRGDDFELSASVISGRVSWGRPENAKTGSGSRGLFCDENSNCREWTTTKRRVMPNPCVVFRRPVRIRAVSAQIARKNRRAPGAAEPSGGVLLGRAAATFVKNPGAPAGVAFAAFAPMLAGIVIFGIAVDPGQVTLQIVTYSLFFTSKLLLIVAAVPITRNALARQSGKPENALASLRYCFNRWRLLIGQSLITAVFSACALALCLMPTALLYLSAMNKRGRESAYEIIAFAGASSGVLGATCLAAVWARYCLAAPVALVEECGTIAALRRAGELSDGRRVILALSGILIFAIFGLMEFAFITIFHNYFPERSHAWAGLLAAEIVCLPIAAVSGIFLAALYDHYRRAEDGLSERQLLEVFD